MDFDTQLNDIQGLKLRDILVEMWIGKWIIISLVVLAGALGAAYLLFVPQTVTASLTVMPMTEAEYSKYRQLTSIPREIPAVPLNDGKSGPENNYIFNFEKDGSQSPKDAKANTRNRKVNPDDPESFFFFFEQEYLMKLLFEDLQERQTLKQAVMKQMAPSGKVDSDTLSQRIEDEVYDYVFTPPTTPEEALNSRTRVVNPNWTIDYTGKARAGVKTVLTEAMKQSTANAAKVLEDQFAQAVAVAERDKSLLTRTISNEMLNARARYEMEVKARLAFLQEQAKIARALGIAKSTIEVQPVGATAQLLTNMPKEGEGGKENSDYLRGYEAIEKEISVIEERKTADLFIPDLLPLAAAERKAGQDDTVERATAAFDKSPIKSGKFMAASYNINSVEVMPKRGPVFVMALFLLAGFGLSLLIIVVRNIMRAPPAKSVA